MLRANGVEMCFLGVVAKFECTCLIRKKSHWEITALELKHNHEVVTPSKMSLIRGERHVSAAQRNLIKTLHVSGVPPRQEINEYFW